MATRHVKSNISRTTVGGIPYTLMAGYPTLRADRDKVSATEKYLINASDIAAFYAESLPPPPVLIGGITLPPRRTMPQNDWLFTKSLNFEPHSADLVGDPFGRDPDNPQKYEQHYVVTIEYETPDTGDDESNTPENQDPDRPETYLERTLSTGAEFMVIDPAKTDIAAVDAGETPSTGQIEENQSTPGSTINSVKIISKIEYTYKWSYVVNPDFEMFRTYQGKVNSVARSMFFNAAPETVLFLGFSGSQKFLWDGSKSISQPWELDFRFSEKVVSEGGKTYGWNHVWHPQKQEWVKILRGGDPPQELHDKADLREMFRRQLRLPAGV